jgi:hypothetical protein
MANMLNNAREWPVHELFFDEVNLRYDPSRTQEDCNQMSRMVVDSEIADRRERKATQAQKTKWIALVYITYKQLLQCHLRRHTLVLSGMKKNMMKLQCQMCSDKKAWTAQPLLEREGGILRKPPRPRAHDLRALSVIRVLRVDLVIQAEV